MSEIKEVQQEFCRDFFEEKHLQEYLEHVTKTLEISSPKYSIKSGSKAGDNYIGIIYLVFIEGKKNKVPVKVQLIFKVPPKDEAMRQILQIGQFFSREHLFYSEIVPVFKELLKEKNKRLENIAECYLSSQDDQKEVICLEDLRVKGFVMRDRIKQLDFEHISLALRALGRFHALSFALRDQRPEIFASKIMTLKETMFRPDLVSDVHFIDNFQKYGDLVKTALAEEDPKYMKRFSEYIKGALNTATWSCDGTAAEPYAVLGHGDFWTNNMLFKYDESHIIRPEQLRVFRDSIRCKKNSRLQKDVFKDTSELKDLYMLDFQLVRYASPVIDISYVLFLNCSQEVRKKHYDELIKIYHESLSAYLSELGSDPKELFPYDALVAQFEKFSGYSAGMAILALPGFTSQGEDISRIKLNYDTVSVLQKRIHRDHFWRNTCRDTFKDLIDRNYI